MRGWILCCLVALAGRYLSLEPKKTYEYKYVGLVNFGRGLPHLAESGVRLTCKVKIFSASAQTFMLQVSDVAFEEFNGVPGKSAFVGALKLAARISAQLAKPFMFEYAGGHVGNIQAPAGTSDTMVNIVRGILGFFQLTVKTTQNLYTVEELGLHGLCQSHYAVEENAAKEMIITQVVDITVCKEKAVLYRGMATAVPDEVAKEKGESIMATVKYVHTVKPTAAGGVITKATALEHQHFTPFNVKGGSFKMLATKELVFISVTNTTAALTSGAMEPKGNIVYKFVNDQANLPIMMQNLDNPIPRIVELVKRLAANNIYQVDSESTEDVMRAYQLLRVVPFEGLDTMWKQFAGNAEHRRWFLNLVVEVNDARVLRFLEVRFKAGDLGSIEAWQTLVLAFNHLQVQPELIEMAKGFLTIPFSKSDQFVWHTVVLSYGSLVYKHCAYYTPCPVTAVQPLLDMALDGLARASEADMVLALKALGNAGHPASIKTILRFLPAVAANPVALPARVQSAAVQALRLIAARDPHTVQEIGLSLFLQRDVPAELRMQILVIIFQTKPPMGLVSLLTSHLMEETDLQVASFAYSYLKSSARSTASDNSYFVSEASTTCNMAVKILAPKFGRLSFRFSKAITMDWFSDEFLMGTATEFLMLKDKADIFPAEMTMKGKYYFIGRILQLLEFGIRPEGIKELFGTGIPGFTGDLGLTDLQAVLKVIQGWEKLPSDKPLMTVFSRASGQEWFFADLKKEVVQSLNKAFSPTAFKDSPILGIIDDLKKGYSSHMTKAFLIFETRYFQASTLGLPIEISKYYESVNAITANVKAAVSPPVTDHLGQLLTADISLETDGFIGSTKDLWMFHGINTELFQFGTELKTKAPTSIPWKFSAKMNIAEKKFELDFPPCRAPVELVSIKSDVYAVSRNIETPALAKMTPMMPNARDSNDEIVLNGSAIVKSEPQVVFPNLWTPAPKMCAESTVFGLGMCMESKLQRAYFQEEYPLYYFLGYTHLAINIVPVQPIKPVEKIHLEVNAGPGRHPINARQLLETLRRLSKEALDHLGSDSGSSSTEDLPQTPRDIVTEILEASPEAVFNVRALAMGGIKPEGFDASLYYTPRAQLEDVQLIVSQTGEAANWKLCTNAVVEKANSLAKAHVRWGAECQSYSMSMQVGTSHQRGTRPALKATLHWAKVPEYMVTMGKSIDRYIPGVALLLAFKEEHLSNHKQEMSASVVAASADSINVSVRFPKYTVYRQAISTPFAVANFQGTEATGNTTQNHA
uniref:Vitellogenin 3, phosvitinless n=1 Tax=Gadus morhua TaxID=8049 RepID=A0A8C5CB38_GADMO